MSKKARGRPRNYDPDRALETALEAFARAGFAGTSLDDISAATGMNRPSLYAAFGDKKSIYRKAVDKFNREFLERLGQALFAGAGLEDDLVGFYLATFPVYLAPGDAPRDVRCFAPRWSSRRSMTTSGPILRAPWTKSTGR